MKKKHSADWRLTEKAVRNPAIIPGIPINGHEIMDHSSRGSSLGERDCSRAVVKKGIIVIPVLNSHREQRVRDPRTRCRIPGRNIQPRHRLHFSVQATPAGGHQARVLIDGEPVPLIAGHDGVENFPVDSSTTIAVACSGRGGVVVAVRVGSGDRAGHETPGRGAFIDHRLVVVRREHGRVIINRVNNDGHGFARAHWRMAPVHRGQSQVEGGPATLVEMAVHFQICHLMHRSIRNFKKIRKDHARTGKKPVHYTFNQSINQSMDQRNEKLINNQSINQSFERWINKSTNQSINGLDRG